MSNCYLGCIASMASWWHKLKLLVILIPDQVLYTLGYLVIHDMFLWFHPYSFQSKYEVIVCLLHFVVVFLFHRLDQDGVTIDFDHHYYVFGAAERRLWK